LATDSAFALTDGGKANDNSRRCVGSVAVFVLADRKINSGKSPRAGSLYLVLLQVIYDFVTFHVLLHNQQAFNLPKR
jgi:hypothetical protein